MGCGGVLSKSESILCFICENNLPKTYFEKDAENVVFKRMYGRIPIQQATSFLYFDKGGLVQHLMHQLKYNDKKEIGLYLGKLLGQQLMQHSAYFNIDMIIPVPLHEKKLYQRGYNQSELFAKGIAEAMNKSLATDIISRIDYTQSQTGKNKFERWENVKDAFRLNNAELIKGKQVLLVDDVITTGATLEACAQHLMNEEDVKISVATIAFAH